MENLCLIAGQLSDAPVVRVLDDGVLATFGVRTLLDAKTVSVPIASFSPPTWLEDAKSGDLVCVVGAVQRRFFQTASGAKASNVTVKASQVVRMTDKRSARRLMAKMQRQLEDLAESI